MPRVVPARELPLDVRAGEQRPDVLLAAPQRRRRGVVRQRRQIAAHDPEELADEAVGRPVDQPDPPVRAADAGQLARGDLVPRRELHAEHRQHDVERRVGERQRLGVTLHPLDVDTGEPGAPPRRVEQLGREIDANDVGTRASRTDRHVAGAGRDVEDLLPGRHRDTAQQVRRRHLVDVLGHRGVVARRPRGPVRLLEIGDCSHRCSLIGDVQRRTLIERACENPAGRLRVRVPGHRLLRPDRASGCQIRLLRVLFLGLVGEFAHPGPGLVMGGSGAGAPGVPSSRRATPDRDVPVRAGSVRLVTSRGIREFVTFRAPAGVRVTFVAVCGTFVTCRAGGALALAEHASVDFFTQWPGLTRRSRTIRAARAREPARPGLEWRSEGAHTGASRS